MIKKTYYYLLILFFISCQVEEGNTGVNTLTNTYKEAIGTNCENGGVKIELGLDKNSNNVLDIDEIETVNYICNGLNGYINLTSVSNDFIDTNVCENGGHKINSGLDYNNNNVLDIEEIMISAIVCDGIEGYKPLTKFVNEPIGVNCDKGGIKISIGLDNNSNGILDNDEIISTSYACNAEDGDLSLTKISDIESGSTCENGGMKIEVGIDLNSNAILDEEEIKTTKTVCNGVDGIGGLEEIRLLILSSGAGASGTDKESGVIVGSIEKFNKKNWSEAKSIIYNSYIYTSNYNNTCYIELYNATDGYVISESTISSNSTMYPGSLVISKNIIDNLPNKEIKLDLRLRSENEGTSVFIGRKSELIINN
ncbi:hypothetical protein CXF68_14345 [Tenacibaculum sp. Bg11-29]|uniref:DUF7151 family protein n=1 Tax=Tenacibaculum sp. Bg11-29 TaxID=2058306 RepID=UPI000C33207C|nr:hypothetical protein [Tenacibaculum sp. Bg11-29]PKH51792.1 hypothetical protein CXF68_14345 [Tenacibaculum sp. Bg11-29]